MSIKHFCDHCGEEIVVAHDGVKQPEFVVAHIRVRLQRSVRRGWNDGDVHVSCLVEIVNQGTRVGPSAPSQVRS